MRATRAAMATWRAIQRGEMRKRNMDKETVSGIRFGCTVLRCGVLPRIVDE
jgi:hypothetical protein